MRRYQVIITDRHHTALYFCVDSQLSDYLKTTDHKVVNGGLVCESVRIMCMWLE